MKIEKLIEFSKEEMKKQYDSGKIDVDFLINYIFEINKTYNLMVDYIKDLTQSEE